MELGLIKPLSPSETNRLRPLENKKKEFYVKKFYLKAIFVQKYSDSDELQSAIHADIRFS